MNHSTPETPASQEINPSLTSKTILRRAHDKENPYFMLARDIPQNKNLSYEAVGLLTYLLSKPDNWQVRPAELIREGCGRDKVYRILQELIQCGHLTHDRAPAKQGEPPVFKGYMIHEQPFFEETESETPIPPVPDNPPFPDLPYPVNAVSGETATHNTDKNLSDSLHPSNGDHLNTEKEHSASEKTGRAPNNLYDAIYKIWKFTAGRNGLMAALLTGKATTPGWKEYNLETPISAEDLLRWAAWYRRECMHDDPNLTMISSPIKVQSSITDYQQRRKRSEAVPS